ncbi:hypothetical protein [Actinacidiphila sp. ITFR-21]|uniref:hypothetical protein n=1 Tax=Actinacidiphila sp. ITFR-21 TaxID=3075199 RepID=UPI0028898E97|nr:hypothetical protein [Streptomyces sp. ITFR-21]WNI20290.1 hypothetical protein RLT57_33015 [Streptomyces sp. ITFR-21]
MAELLGCPQQYRAIIHWRGGARPFTSPDVSALTAVKWNRTLNDTAEGTITIAKGTAGADCCGLLGQIEPYAHELTLYRDTELVWQGPVIRTRETRATFVVEAHDVTEWLARTVNTTVLRYLSTNTADPMHMGPVQEIAHTIIRLNLQAGLFASQPDWPEMLPYIVRLDDPVKASFEKDGSDNASVWIVPILQIINDELVPRGLEYTTVGRSLLLSRPMTTADPAQARLTLNDIAGDVQIVRDGPTGASIVWVTNQVGDEISGTEFGVSGVISPEYGRLDTLIKTSAEGLTAYDLWQIARASYNGRYPVPTSLTIPEGSTLAPTAPVSMRQLVPGQRIDVAATGMCNDLNQPYRLADVEVEWGASGEQVGVGLVPIGEPYTGDPP